MANLKIARYHKIILLFSVIFLFLSISVFFRENINDNFLSNVAKCNSVVTRLRFSCYRSAIEKSYHNNLSGLLSELKDNKNFKFDAAFSSKKAGDVSYAIFGTNCHTFYHAVGDFIATNTNEDIKSSLEYCPSTCTAGCTMGLYKRTALKNNFSTALLSRFYNICRENERNQCAHEIGHLLHDKYSYSILKVLDNISYKEYGLKQPEQYNYGIEKAKVDLNAPFEECKNIISENKWAQCFTGIGHNLFLFSEFSGDGYKSTFEECDKNGGANKDNCFAFLIYRIGINDAATKFLSDKFDEGRKVCDDTVSLIKREDLKQHCYLGIGGGIGLFLDSEYGSAAITGANISQVKNDLLKAAYFCERSEKGFSDYCLRGLWGTGFKKLYKNLNVYYEPLEKLIPELDSDFEVVG